ncbi:MAG TPA: caspase family protein [Blastocatellia bacterium]|nr:caspase family protein [Blastocatellia bacterium]
MPKGISLNIGLNFVDSIQYGDSYEELQGCEKDARAMQALAAGQGFQTKLLINNQATSNAVIGEIKNAASQLIGGDFFLLSYSGHGSQLINELNGDEEPDGLDETWVLFDRNLIDDELDVLWSYFLPDVRILVVSDSCNSGTITRSSLPSPRVSLVPTSQAGQIGQPGRRSRRIRRGVQTSHMSQFRKTYDDILSGLSKLETYAICACVMSLSACEDGQSADDGMENGAFTEALLRVWDNGAFIGDYGLFYDRLLDENLGIQKPKFSLSGNSSANFKKQRPFTI